MRSRELWFTFAAFAVVLFLAKPATLWEFDEPLFAQALHHYDPVAHHPPPPGYPVFIFVGQIVRRVMPSDFATLVTLSFLGSCVAFVMLALAMGRRAAALFYFSPVMLVHAASPISEPGALALLASALFFMPTSPALFGVFAALTIGWRPQFCIFVLPLLTIWFLLPAAREGGARSADAGTPHEGPRMIAAFTLVGLLWFIPLTMAVGGIGNLVRFESGQAQYLAAHDADTSRLTWGAAAIAKRFIADSWGPPLMSLPILGFAAAGAYAMRRDRKALRLFGAAIVYLVFALMLMDPADGARYAIPFTLVVAIAASGAMRPAFVAVFAAASILYTSSILVQRSTQPSPALQAMQRVKPHDVVLYELPLWPHATYWLRDHPLYRVDDGLTKYFDDPRTSLVLYAEGESDPAGALNFRWAASDAYATLTRNHYRVASLTPLPPERRFLPVRGVHAPEREAEGDEWRWLDVDAEMKLPSPGATKIMFVLGLPLSAPIADNDVGIYLDGALQRRIHTMRGRTTIASIDLSQPATTIRFISARSFNGDRRRLAVRLHDLSLHLAAAAAPRARAAG